MTPVKKYSTSDFLNIQFYSKLFHVLIGNDLYVSYVALLIQKFGHVHCKGYFREILHPSLCLSLKQWHLLENDIKTIL